MLFLTSKHFTVSAWQLWYVYNVELWLDCGISYNKLPWKLRKSSEKNYQRAAEILDGWISQVLLYPMSKAELKSIQGRMHLISDLKCHDFQWYLDTVLPDIFIPWANATMQGQIENFSSRMCLLADRKGQTDNAHCSKHDRRTYFYYTNDRRVFSSSGHCLLPRADDGPVKMSKCSPTATPDQQWDFVVDIDQKINTDFAKIFTSMVVRFDREWWHRVVVLVVIIHKPLVIQSLVEE